MSGTLYLYAGSSSDNSVTKDTADNSEQQVPKKESFSNDDIAKVSETFGHFIAKNLETPGFTFDLDAIIRGMHNALAGEEPPLSEEEYEAMVTVIQENAFLEISENNLSDAVAFMEENIENDDVVEIEAGKLQYIILEEGSGAEIAENGTATIHYTGKCLDGTVFGSSLDSGEPITLSLDQTVPGFSRGLVGMKQGEKRRIFIHPDMGYGTAGQLPPNSLLIFDIEVVDANATIVDIDAEE